MARTFYVTTEATEYRGAYVEAESAEEAENLVLSGKADTEFLCVEGLAINSVEDITEQQEQQLYDAEGNCRQCGGGPRSGQLCTCGGGQ